MSSKTIQIFLKDSDFKGIKIADLSNSIVRTYVIPRDKTAFIQTRSDLSSPALYMLFDDERTSVYIGESENFKDRIVSHITNKSFWQWAVVCVSNNGDGLDKADVKFLESHSIQRAIEINRFDVLNRTTPIKNKLHEFKMETALDVFNDIELLVSTLGFNLFEPINQGDFNKEVKIKEKPITQKDEREYDTIIGPATGDGRVEAFEKKNAWWAIRIGEQNINKFKYVGLYEGAPVSAIRYYARITKIEPYADIPGKYIIHHDGDIQELKNHVVIGNHPELALYGPRYFKLDDIKKSKSLIELMNKAFGSNHQK